MTDTNVLMEAKEIEAEIIEYRRFLHKNAEVGFRLDVTLEYVKKKLKDIGYEIRDCGKAGVYVIAGNEENGKVFLLRADMDALEIKEETNLGFASDNGCMHACGHDMHTAMLLGAAKILKKHENEIKGQVKLMFQPAEEILQGAKDMLDNGILENPKVDAAFMIHVMAGMKMETGSTVVSSEGVGAPAADNFTIDVIGKGCHGSMPNMGVDPISISAQIITALMQINSRETGINEPNVLTIGSIEGGNIANVIPDRVRFCGTIRAYDETVREFVKKRMEEIATGIAKTMRAKVEIRFDNGCPTLINSGQLSKNVVKYLSELLGNTKVFSSNQLINGNSKKTAGGAEDFSYISHRVPSLMVAISAGNAEDGYIYPQHNSKVDYDEDVLYVGSAMYAYVAMRWLEENKKI